MRHSASSVDGRPEAVLQCWKSVLGAGPVWYPETASRQTLPSAEVVMPPPTVHWTHKHQNAQAAGSFLSCRKQRLAPAAPPTPCAPRLQTRHALRPHCSLGERATKRKGGETHHSGQRRASAGRRALSPRLSWLGAAGNEPAVAVPSAEPNRRAESVPLGAAISLRRRGPRPLLHSPGGAAHCPPQVEQLGPTRKKCLPRRP